MLKFKDLEVGKKYTAIGEMSKSIYTVRNGLLYNLTCETYSRMTFNNAMEFSFKEVIDYVTFEEAKEYMESGYVCEFHGFDMKNVEYVIKNNVLQIYSSLNPEEIGEQCIFNMGFLEAKWVKK